MPGKEIDSKGKKGREPKETGTARDGQKEAGSRHTMGEYHEGTDHHDCHRGK